MHIDLDTPNYEPAPRVPAEFKPLCVWVENISHHSMGARRSDGIPVQVDPDAQAFVDVADYAGCWHFRLLEKDPAAIRRLAVRMKELADDHDAMHMKEIYEMAAEKSLRRAEKLESGELKK